MSSPLYLPPEAAAALARGATLVTANTRAARTLRRAFDSHQRAASLRTWAPPPILSWSAFTHSLYQQLLIEGHETRLLLQPFQEHTLWTAIIAADSKLSTLTAPESLADLAQHAWSTLAKYNADHKIPKSPDSTDAKAFQRWATSFVSHCKKNTYLPSAVLERTLAANQKLKFPNEIALIGFDGLTPSQQTLADAISRAGSTLSELELSAKTHKNPESQVIAAKTQTEEITAAALSLRNYLKTNRLAQLAVIVPDLATLRAEIEPIFRNILHPESQNILAKNLPPVFEFSLGTPLSSIPQARAALEILRWSAAPLPIDTITQLLLGPFLGKSPNTASRAAFDAYDLRKQPTLRPELTLESLEKRLKSHTNAELRTVVQAVIQASKRPTKPQTYADWAHHFRQILAAAEWPGIANDSTAFQLREKWEATLDTLSMLDFEGTRIPFATALQALNRLADQTLFSPENTNAPIQIMGIYESAGSVFDALWFLNATESTWPPVSSPLPFVPYHLQRDLHLPAADPNTSQTQAIRVTARIRNSAPITHFSYTTEANHPSQLLPNLPPTDAPSIPPAPTPNLSTDPDHHTLPPLPDAVIHGGAALLKAQAACPYRAFAEHRIFSTGIPQVGPGLNALDSGNLVHNILESFWTDVQSQDQLRALAAGPPNDLGQSPLDRELHKFIRIAVQRAAPTSSPWDTAYLQLQQDRLFNLLRPWMDIELARENFRVQHLEHRTPDAQVGNLRLQIRADRVDRLVLADPDDPNAPTVLIDYKTGSAKSRDWLEERIDDPQLPLYAVLSAMPDLEAVAFASIRPGKDLGFDGLATRAGILPGVKANDSFGDYYQQWQSSLHVLANEFHTGVSTVTPKSFPTTCKYCGQHLLCRISELREDFDQEEEGEEEIA